MKKGPIVECTALGVWLKSNVSTSFSKVHNYGYFMFASYADRNFQISKKEPSLKN